jgi:hypothetical protein
MSTFAWAFPVVPGKPGHERAGRFDVRPVLGLGVTSVFSSITTPDTHSKKRFMNSGL